MYAYCDRLYVSNDRGSTWLPRGTPSPANTIVRAYAGGTFFASGSSYAKNQAEIDATNDLGQSWYPIPFPAAPNSYVIDLQPDPSNPRGLFLLTNDALLKSTDLGANWVSIGPKSTNTHQPLTLNFSGFLVDPDSSSVIHLCDSYLGMEKTTDGGASWYEVNTGFPQLTDWSPGLAGMGSGSAVVYAIFGTSIGCPSSASALNLESAQSDDVPPLFFRSVDAGETWEPMSTPPGDTFGLTLAVDPRNPSHVFAGSFGYCEIGAGDAYESTDGGLTWMTIERNLPRTHILQLVLSTDGTRLYAVGGPGILELMVGRSVPRITPALPVTVAPIHRTP